MKLYRNGTSGKWQVARKATAADLVTCHLSRVTCRGFTMVEIAISLAVIGIALVGIIGILPYGMRVQKDNREKTVINEDATVFLDAIRNGSRGLDDLTNYVFAITNYWTLYKPDGTVDKSDVDGYSLQASRITKIASPPFLPITNGLRIIGLLSTPEFTTGLPDLLPTNNLFSGGYSNHVIAYVRSLSGPATEKPPQDNQLMKEAAFSYKILCVNAPVAVDTNTFNSANYFSPEVYRSVTAYNRQLAANLHELRLTFLWPILPNGNVGTGRQTYRATVPGQIRQDANNNSLYFFQSQSFTNAP